MIVGVIPNSPDFAHPADRRRYPPYFRAKGIAYETADFETAYDAVYISIAADLGKWAEYREHQRARGHDVRVVFDLSDCYLMADPVRDALRSVYHYAVGRTSRFSFSYKQALIRMMASAHVVLCGSEEQKAILSEYHGNVVVVRDDFSLDVRAEKTGYALRQEGTINVLWEGFAHGNVGTFRLLRKILDGLPGLRVHLHVATDSQYCKVGARHFCQPTFSVLQQVFRGSSVRFHMYDWDASTFSALATACDLALIPIPNDPIMIMKPENKLLLLWTLGLPVITADTPSYSRVMREIGQPYACGPVTDWRRRVEELAGSQPARERYMQSARQYLGKHLSRDALTATWDRVFFGPVT